jgi:6-phosphogluconolactonase (cycloisomerase 2 family)
MIKLTLLLFLSISALANANSEVSSQLYTQTNGVENEVIHYARSADGRLTEIERVTTHGVGSGTYKPITGEKNAPNAFEAVGSVILTSDHRYLFVTNGGNNTVSSFRVGPHGKLTFIDVEWTGQVVSGLSGTAKSLTFSAATQTLYVGHAFGPDHIHLFSVREGFLSLRSETYSVNTPIKNDRVISQITLSPDGSFLMADVLFDKRPGTNPDGSADLEVANTSDGDGLAIFPVDNDGALGAKNLTNAGGAAPFVITFLHGSTDTFVQALAVGDGLLLGHIDVNGNVTHSAITPLDTRLGKISEVCWVAISPDNTQVLATALAYGYVTSYAIKNGRLEIAQDPAAPAVPGDGTFHAINGDLTSSPIDNWLSPDGRYFYQLYPNASKLIAYELDQKGGLH